jgi:hypothetical protein
MVKIITFKGWWAIKDVSDNPSWLFIFGDNDAKFGKGGSSYGTVLAAA